MDKLEADILKAYPELQEALNNYRNANNIFNETKQTQINTVKAEIADTQKYLNEIKTTISSNNDKNKVKENSTSDETKLKNEYNFQGDLTITNNDDGSYSVKENGDGYENTYEIDKDGKITSFTSSLGEMKDNGNGTFSYEYNEGKNSITLQGTINDIVKEINTAEQIVYDAKNLLEGELSSYKQEDYCVVYTQEVMRRNGITMPDYSKDVKDQGTQIEFKDAVAGDIYNNTTMHIGIVAFSATDDDGNELLFTIDHTKNGTNVNERTNGDIYRFIKE